MKAQQRAEAIELMLEDLGIEPERFRLEWVSASEGPALRRVCRRSFTERNQGTRAESLRVVESATEGESVEGFDGRTEGSASSTE